MLNREDGQYIPFLTTQNAYITFADMSNDSITVDSSTVAS